MEEHDGIILTIGKIFGYLTIATGVSMTILLLSAIFDGGLH